MAPINLNENTPFFEYPLCTGIPTLNINTDYSTVILTYTFYYIKIRQWSDTIKRLLMEYCYVKLFNYRGC